MYFNSFKYYWDVFKYKYKILPATNMQIQIQIQILKKKLNTTKYKYSMYLTQAWYRLLHTPTTAIANNTPDTYNYILMYYTYCTYNTAINIKTDRVPTGVGTLSVPTPVVFLKSFLHTHTHTHTHTHLLPLLFSPFHPSLYHSIPSITIM